MGTTWKGLLAVVSATFVTSCLADASDQATVLAPAAIETAGRGEVRAFKYYDANADGDYDWREPVLTGWPIQFTRDGVTQTFFTGGGGHLSTWLAAGTYRVTEAFPLAPTTWIQTGNVVNQATAWDGSSVTLEPDLTYTAVVADGGTIAWMKFGNVCVGSGGGHTPGFWSNRNGAALVGADDLALMRLLNLRDAIGPFDPVDYAGFRAWLVGASAEDMGYMLSAQLAAMKLSVLNGFVSPTAVIHAPGTPDATAAGFAPLALVVAAADVALSDPSAFSREELEALKNALGDANDDNGFVQPTPDACPTPVFP